MYPLSPVPNVVNWVKKQRLTNSLKSDLSFWLHVRGFVTVNTIQYDDIFCVFLSIKRVCYRQHYSTSTNHPLSKLITEPASSSSRLLAHVGFESGSFLQGSPAKCSVFSVVSSLSRTSDSRGRFFLAPLGAKGVSISVRL